MHEGNEQFDDLQAISSYNQELFSCFLNSREKAIHASFPSEHLKNQLIQGLDLIKAINHYRNYKNPECFLEAFPQFQDQEESIMLLWQNLHSLSPQELSDLMIEMIHEVSKE